MSKKFKFIVTTKVIPIHCIRFKNKRLECGNVFYVNQDELKEIQEYLKKGYIEKLGEIDKTTLLIDIDCDGDECGDCRHQSYSDEIGFGKMCRLFGERISLKRCESCLNAGKLVDKAMGALDLQNIRAGNFNPVKGYKNGNEKN